MRFSSRVAVENNQVDARQDGTAEAFLRDQILRRERGQGNIHFPCSADHEEVGNLLIYTLLYKGWDDYT